MDSQLVWWGFGIDSIVKHLERKSIWHTSQNTPSLLCTRAWSRDLWVQKFIGAYHANPRNHRACIHLCSHDGACVLPLAVSSKHIESSDLPPFLTSPPGVMNDYRGITSAYQTLGSKKRDPSHGEGPKGLKGVSGVLLSKNDILGAAVPPRYGDSYLVLKVEWVGLVEWCRMTSTISDLWKMMFFLPFSAQI